ncbi:MAG: IS110 family transposase [Acetobacteraceae bacterium]
MNDQPGSTARQSPVPIFVSVELSRVRWLVTWTFHGSSKMSKTFVRAGDGAGLLALLAQIRTRAERAQHLAGKIIVVQEAGLDGFWVHRLLESQGLESHVVDPASIAVPRRQRRPKSDAIDGETLLRVLMAWKRGEPRVCSMVVPPAPEEEARRRLVRERKMLVAERTRETNRIRGLLASQGVVDYDPLRRDCRVRLEGLRTGDGRALPQRFRAEIARALDRIELVERQIAELEAERNALVHATSGPCLPAARLLALRGIGPESAAVLSLECFFRHFDNRRQLAAYAGLAPSPWQSGRVEHTQGISKAGNGRLRTAMVELAWLWLRYQPASALAAWFRQRVRAERGRPRRIAIVALARKLLVALWRYVTAGQVPEGAVLKEG